MFLDGAIPVLQTTVFVCACKLKYLKYIQLAKIETLEMPNISRDMEHLELYYVVSGYIATYMCVVYTHICVCVCIYMYMETKLKNALSYIFYKQQLEGDAFNVLHHGTVSLNGKTALSYIFYKQQLDIYNFEHISYLIAQKCHFSVFIQYKLY